MIITDFPFSNITITALCFGNGDILVSTGKGKLKDNGHYSVVAFKNHEPMPIGEITNEYMGKNSDELAPEAVMFFTRPESIDVVIHSLNEAKELLINQLNAST